MSEHQLGRAAACGLPQEDNRSRCTPGVQGTIHAGLGSWLRRSQGLPVLEAFQEAQAGHAPRWPCHPWAVIRIGKLTTSAGSLVLALLVSLCSCIY